jgi:hypothetical protein
MKLKGIMGVLLTAILIGAGLLITDASIGQERLPDLDLPEIDESGAPPGPPGSGWKGRQGPQSPEDMPGIRPDSRGQGRPGDRPALRPGIRDERRQMMLKRIRQEDPKRYRQLVRIGELVEEYRTTGDENRKKEIEKDLRPLVEKELKQQQEEAKKKAEEWEKKLARFKEILKERDENWEEVVDYNVKKITGQKAYLDFPRGPLK